MSFSAKDSREAFKTVPTGFLIFAVGGASYYLSIELRRNKKLFGFVCSFTL
jgi:hypothetical protein